jgi:exopolysaccharide biosynthesis WecB/TagA/CpsF family protein
MTALATTRTFTTGAEIVSLSDIRAGAVPSAIGRLGRTVRLFGLSITDCTVAGASGWLVARAAAGLRTDVGFVNAHCVNTLYRDGAYREALSGMDVLFADGSGMSLAARAAGETLADNVNGTDLFPVLCRDAAGAGVSLYLLGGGEGVSAKAGAALAASTPGLEIAGARSGFFATPAEEQAAIDAINASGAGIVLVGMGVPLQELWIARNRHRLSAAVVIGVGGLFDYYSGRIPRAPLAVRKVGMEWAWRLAMEPRPLARRYLVGNLEFVARLAMLRALAPVELAGRAVAR